MRQRVGRPGVERGVLGPALGVLLGLLACGPVCDTEKYCRVFDLLGACTSAACDIEGGALKVSGPDDSSAGSLVAPTSYGSPNDPVVHVTIDLGQYSGKRDGLDVLRIEVSANEAFTPSALVLGPPSALAACTPGPYSMFPGFVCDASALAGAKLELTLSPPYPSFGLRVYYQQSKCTSERTVCPA